MRRWRQAGLRAVAIVVAGGSGCAGPDVTVLPDAKALSAHVTTIVELPPSLSPSVGGEAEQRRTQRRTGDALVALTGGRAVIAEELRGTDDNQIVESLRALGEDPARALTFSVMVSRHFRQVAGAAPIPGFRPTHQLVADFVARLEVRAAGRADVIGVVDTVVAADPNGPEIGPAGQSMGAQKAVDDALAEAVRAFAPQLLSREPAALLVEVPASIAAGVVPRLRALQEIYPELSIEDIQLLASSSQQLLVIRPGNLAAWGLTAGDLLEAPAGHALGGRAALARSAAHGAAPALAVERKGARYMLAQAGRP
jgi:hypothetical protein